jgi:hypothetical protein
MSEEPVAPTTEQVYRFLRAAATDPGFQTTLRTADAETLAEAINNVCGATVIAAEDIPEPDKRSVAFPGEARHLIDYYGLEAEPGQFNAAAIHKQYTIGSSRLAPLINVVGFAMPLATVDEVAAAS